MAPVYMAFLRFMGDEIEAKNYGYSLEVGGYNRKLIWEGTPRSIRDSHRKVRDSHDGLIIQRNMALFFSGGDRKELKLRAGRATSRVCHPRISNESELPTVVTNHTANKSGHGFISTPSLQLMVSALPLPTSPTLELLSRPLFLRDCLRSNQALEPNLLILSFPLIARHLLCCHLHQILRPDLTKQNPPSQLRPYSPVLPPSKIALLPLASEFDPPCASRRALQDQYPTINNPPFGSNQIGFSMNKYTV
ncbi:hypothetical protein Cgig2_003674 [Carnegiea gigantea]|uniref:Seven-in-absentia protein TRAF-like domain-containing protein n=1 Tax=Carnegiea gigantea TaxID=171969 RepID=A0A9Q1KGP8_9CARY|nr:hypothetical protein Cgig2_003674 [Carnegiea gigantea]